MYEKAGRNVNSLAAFNLGTAWLLVDSVVGWAMQIESVSVHTVSRVVATHGAYTAGFVFINFDSIFYYTSKELPLADLSEVI
jgi:hypothetical protein